MDRPADAFRTISEVAEDLDLPQHVLRFWETKFTQIRPLKRGGGRRYYRPDDVELLRAIRHLLYGEGYTIRGVQRILKEQGVKAVISLRVDGDGAPMARQAPADRGEPDALRETTASPRLSAAHDDAFDLNQAGADVPAKLRGVLADLAECARILEAARTG